MSSFINKIKLNAPGLLIFVGVALGAVGWSYFSFQRGAIKLTPAIENKQIKKVIASIDENDDDDDDDQEKPKEDEKVVIQDDEAEYKAKYDDTIRLAKKLLSGNAYLRAAEKFKEAIKLAEHVPSASKDLITLYNNSSAMYEKAGVYEESLLDINIVLHMDNKHVKARLRRARIYEAQVNLVLIYWC